MVDIQRAVSDLPVEITGLLKAQFLDEVLHGGLLLLHLAVLELTLQRLLGEECLLDLCLLESKTDL